MTLASGADQAPLTGKSYDRGAPDGLTAGAIPLHQKHAQHKNLTVKRQTPLCPFGFRGKGGVGWLVPGQSEIYYGIFFSKIIHLLAAQPAC